MIEEENGSDEFTATTWVHMDCREFRKYKSDKFFKTTESELLGTKLLDLIETSDNGDYNYLIETK